MRKVNIVVPVLVVLTLLSSFIQADDYFLGKWEIMVAGTPNGDIKFATDLQRKEGKLFGELTIPADPNAPAIPITNIEEGTDKITIYFSAQGYDLNLDLEKVDQDNLKGTLMGMFDSKAVRVKVKTD
ncbi:MAG: hypothetical protein IPP61_13375 [Cytophagaceae bacterium]|nr:hypothetical protein [Cytophagaceae bacterium]MBL0303300.1 hypothetical protein [Cytophagaceae bacterium]MBL0326149.1 hypothetical protein [Cytophagaceae bacterium]